MSKELLRVILEACTDFHSFLTVDLQGASLATEVEGRRQQLVLTTSDIIAKIRSSHVSVRPWLYTPTDGQAPPVIGKKPPAKPPAILPEEGEQEMYVECEGQDHLPEDYLTFTSQSPQGEDSPQGMYETMANTDEPLDVYEEPVQGVLSPQPPISPHPLSSQNDDVQQEMYEEPIVSPFPSGLTPTPPPSTENSGSGAVYARANVHVPPAGAAPSETATEWIYDATKKEERLKISQLENVMCKGNLEKLGGKNKKNWQVRFCVLSGPFMYFYEKESSKSYRNRITLPMYVAEGAPEYTNAKKRHFAFKLTHTDATSGKKKDYFFRSSKKESCETWLQAIRSVCDRTVNCDSQHVAITLSPVTSASSVAAGGEAANPDVEQEMYEPIEEMTLSDENNDQEEYVDVQPAADQGDYVAVEPSQLEDEAQVEYEETSQFISPPPPPLSHSPHSHPPSSHPPPSHRPDPPVDISKVYEVAPNGIDLQKVYVALWDFIGSEGDELSMQRGDLVHVADPDSSAEWWAGEGLDPNAAAKTGLFGFLPATFVTAAFEEVV